HRRGREGQRLLRLRLHRQAVHDPRQAHHAAGALDQQERLREEGLMAKIDVAPHNMSGNSAPSPYVAAASSEFSATFAAYKAFNGSVGTGAYWLGTGSGVDWLSIDLGSGNTYLLVY